MILNFKNKPCVVIQTHGKLYDKTKLVYEIICESKIYFVHLFRGEMKEFVGAIFYIHPKSKLEGYINVYLYPQEKSYYLGRKYIYSIAHREDGCSFRSKYYINGKPCSDEEDYKNKLEIFLKKL